MLQIHYVHWNGICEIITSPARTQLRVNIPSNALLIMTVHTLIKAYRLLLTTYHLPPTTYYCLAHCALLIACCFACCLLLAAYCKL